MGMLASWVDFFANVAQVFLLILGMFLILVVLLQRGRGGGLAGAFGGAGGQSAFGTKAGDVFTKITIGIAVLWVVTNGVSGMLIRNSQSVISSSQFDDDVQPGGASIIGSGEVEVDEVPMSPATGDTNDGSSPFVFPDTTAGEADTTDDAATGTDPEPTNDGDTSTSTTEGTEGAATTPADDATTTTPETPAESATEESGESTETDATATDETAAAPSN